VGVPWQLFILQVAGYPLNSKVLGVFPISNSAEEYGMPAGVENCPTTPAGVENFQTAPAGVENLPTMLTGVENDSLAPASVETRQPAHCFAYCDSFYGWTHLLLLLSTSACSLIFFPHQPARTFCFPHRLARSPLSLHTGRRTIMASDTYYWAQSGLKNAKTF
jgi:hypothetical protein